MNEIKINKEDKFCVINCRRLMEALVYMTGQRPYRFDDRKIPGFTKWSFVNDEAFQEAFQTILEIRNKNVKKVKS